MSDESILKSLGRETKALIIVNEFEARRMPMFQLRDVLNALVVNEEEKKFVIDLVENDLRATGYQLNQINAFLQDLLQEQAIQPVQSTQVTRRLRSPFSQSFEASAPVQAPAALAPAAPVAAPPAIAAAVPPAAALPGFSVTPQQRPPGPAYSIGQAQPPSPLPPAGSTPVRATGVGLPAVALPGATSGQRTGAQFAGPADVKPKVPLSTGPSAVDPNASQGVSKPGETMFFGSGAGVDLPTKPKILLADDDKRIRIVFKMCLERMGLTVVEAKDGNEAWELVQGDGFSMIVLDMKMPGLHGLEVLTRMTTKQIKMPVIVCSAYDNLKEEFVIATYPNLRYLVKPVAAEALESAARELLGMPAE